VPRYARLTFLGELTATPSCEVSGIRRQKVKLGQVARAPIGLATWGATEYAHIQIVKPGVLKIQRSRDAVLILSLVWAQWEWRGWHIAFWSRTVLWRFRYTPQASPHVAGAASWQRRFPFLHHVKPRRASADLFILSTKSSIDKKTQPQISDDNYRNIWSVERV